jgi:glutathione S-transferase
MRLLYSAGSPFARVMRIASLETGLERPRGQARGDAQTALFAGVGCAGREPGRRVPTLELDDGTILSDRKLILDYIDALNPGPKLLPRDGSDGWRTLAEMGKALGLLEGIVTWIRALVSPEPQLAAVAIAREAERVNRAADVLEHAIARGAYAGRLDAAQIVLATALRLVEKRLPVWKWRERRSALSSWYDAIAARASFRMTEPPRL